MIKHVASWLKVFISIILIFTFMPIQANASQDDVPPKVISSSISEKIIAYKGLQNPGFTTIKFTTNKPVVAYLQVSSPKGSTRIKLSEWLNKKSEYEVSFVPMDYKKAYYDKFEPLSPGTYNVKLELHDENYNQLIQGIGTIKIVKKNKEQPLVEILDIKITNEVKDLQIAPKMKFKYKVNRPAFIEAPIFYDYHSSYVEGERTLIHYLPIEEYVKTPGIYEVAWDLKALMGVLQNNKLIRKIQNERVLPGEYKLFFRSQEESIKKYATQTVFGVLNNDEEIDLLVTSDKSNTEIKILDGWTPQKELEVTPKDETYDIVHYVTAGETLWKVSQKYDVSLEDTANKNNIDINSHLTVGQKITIPTSMVKFEDIQDHWSKDNILFLSAKKIIKGVGNNKFNPNKNITRAEYMTMIVKALNENIDHKDKSSFTDIQPNQWYHDIVETALELGLITGYEDHTFRPNKSITRQEMTTIAEKALHYKTAQQPIMDENILDVLDMYKDKDNISSWARISVAIATNYDLVRGKSNNLFDPNGISTRAEGATIVKHLYDYINANSK